MAACSCCSLLSCYGSAGLSAGLPLRGCLLLPSPPLLLPAASLRPLGPLVWLRGSAASLRGSLLSCGAAGLCSLCLSYGAALCSLPLPPPSPKEGRGGPLCLPSCLPSPLKRGGAALGPAGLGSAPAICLRCFPCLWLWAFLLSPACLLLP